MSELLEHTGYFRVHECVRKCPFVLPQWHCSSASIEAGAPGNVVGRERPEQPFHPSLACALVSPCGTWFSLQKGVRFYNHDRMILSWEKYLNILMSRNGLLLELPRCCNFVCCLTLAVWRMKSTSLDHRCCIHFPLPVCVCCCGLLDHMASLRNCVAFLWGASLHFPTAWSRTPSFTQQKGRFFFLNRINAGLFLAGQEGIKH